MRAASNMADRLDTVFGGRYGILQRQDDSMSNRDFFIQMLEHEHNLTKKVIGATPGGNLDYRPHEKCRTARELIGHMVGHYGDLAELIEDGVIHHRMEEDFADIDDAVAQADSTAAALKDKLGTANDEAWGTQAKMWVGDYMAWEASTGEIMWGFLFDLIHHRGQLSTYIRPMGGKVPGIYGPSADDPGH